MQAEHEDHFVVVVIDELQYSLWPVGREIPGGWRAEPVSGPRAQCLDYIARTWTDMRPLSVRPGTWRVALNDAAAPPNWFDELFRSIDEANWPAMANFFHADIVYERPGYPADRRPRRAARLLPQHAHRRPRPALPRRQAARSGARPSAGASSTACPRPATC
jgi:MbtH protein